MEEKHGKIRSRINRIGTLPDDSKNRILQKQTLVMASILITVAGIIWSVMYLSLGFYLTAFFPFAYSFLISVLILVFAKRKNYKFFLNAKLVLILILPFLVQVSLGGFSPSGSVMIWGLLAPLGALLFDEVKNAIRWFLAFASLITICTFCKGFPGYEIQEISLSLQRLFFAMNILAVTTIAFYASAHFVKQQNIIRQENKHLFLEVNQKSEEIKSSIQYAKSIQEATLPREKRIKQYLPDSFIYFKPKDLVSGDMYWVKKVGDKTLFSVVDCVGHGVPGAFVSLVAQSALNRIVNEHQISTPAEILNQLNEMMVEAFESISNDLDISMDLSLCSLDKKNMMLEYAGANSKLYIIKNGAIHTMKPNKLSLSAKRRKQPFQNNLQELQKGDMIYLFTDGYADQFGGPKQKKFMYRQFKDLLISIHQKPMQEQYDALDNTLSNWMGNTEQVDDICVMGCKI